MNELIVVFLLFFAALAAGWFYLQRAKSRTVSRNDEADTPVAADRIE